MTSPVTSDTERVPPDYAGGGLLNLMASLEAACGGKPTAATAPALPPSRLAAANNVVFVVMDGLGYRYLAARTPGGTLARHLHGALSSVFPATTASAVTTTMTGRAPFEHGLTGWHMWLQELGAVASILPLRNREGGTPLAVDPQMLFPCGSLFDRITRESYVVSPRSLIDSTFNIRHSGRAARRSYAAPAEFFPTVARTLRENATRKFIYAYYPEFDNTAHAHGVASPAAAAEFALIDAAFDRFLGGIAGTGTAVVLTADHGFIDSPPERVIELDAHPRLAAMLARPLCGERRAAYAYVKPEADAAFCTYVAHELAHTLELVPRHELLARGWFGPGIRHPQLAERIGDYALLMRANWTIKDWLPGEKRHPMIGVHGGLTPEEMLIPLIYAEA